VLNAAARTTREGRLKVRAHWEAMDRALPTVSRAVLVVLPRERRVLVGGLGACLAEGRRTRRSRGFGDDDMIPRFPFYFSVVVAVPVYGIP